MVPFGRMLLIRNALLVAVAFCIAAAVMSEDRNARLLAAAAAIVIEIVRDAVLAGAIAEASTHRKHE